MSMVLTILVCLFVCVVCLFGMFVSQVLHNIAGM